MVCDRAARCLLSNSCSRRPARLLNNPWAQPPSASDWVVQPTHPRHDPVPYYLAPLWDAHFAHREQSKTSRSLRNTDNNPEQARISKEVRKRLKHARAARGLLQDLEEGIRRFIQSWNEKQRKLQNRNQHGASSDDDVDSEDEVVFLGRNAEKRDRLPPRKQNSGSASEERDGEMMVFESPVHDRGGVFGYVPSRLPGDTNRLTCPFFVLVGAGWCIPSHHITDCIHGPSPSATRAVGRPMLAFIRRRSRGAKAKYPSRPTTPRSAVRASPSISTNRCRSRCGRKCKRRKPSYVYGHVLVDVLVCSGILLLGCFSIIRRIGSLKFGLLSLLLKYVELAILIST